MKVGDLVRNIHTVLGGSADDRGVIVEKGNRNDWIVRVVWHNTTEIYQTWMDCSDLEVVSEGR